ncbi:hypothetical protein C3K47_08585 [Solitalea longa]|uniref:Phenylacetate--CoA ligase family protein n=1 Tax=Solitalea longa TaxID=2079460 RepID=A0A2S5A4S4_9SPHI|nr:phenylacetate--CoA ligase family protein [Solitalea longa]POY37103.1 hypothetical protein C3K47_08585 [Solitalea longa]
MKTPTTLRENFLRLCYKTIGRKEMSLYDQFLTNQNKSYDELVFDQNKQLKKLIEFAYREVPYYHSLFDKNGVNPTDIKTIDDLYKIPVSTKLDIRNHIHDLSPKNLQGKYISKTTGGSTGLTLRYKMSIDCASRGTALLYRGWGLAGYVPGDPISFFGGGSLVAKKRTAWSRIGNFAQNIYQTSCYGLTEEDLNTYFNNLKHQQPIFIRGYPTSIMILAKYIDNLGGLDKVRIQPIKGIFCTAEVLFDNQRRYIEKVFRTTVYNQYGLNDGGVSAYENGIIPGLMIDTERAVMECVDKSGKNQLHQAGSIVATSLYNYAFPFIRYDTGDIGEFDDSYIKTGGNRMLLKQLLGRTTEVMKINGKLISGIMLAACISEVDVLNFQIIHKKDDSLKIIINRGGEYNVEQENFIRKSLTSNLGNIRIDFDYDANFVEGGNKHKFILKENA